MQVDVSSYLNSLGSEYGKIDLNSIQEIISETYYDNEPSKEALGDPQTVLIAKMKDKGLTTPDGLHFHTLIDGVLCPPEDPFGEPVDKRLVLFVSNDKGYELSSVETGSEIKPTSCWICGTCLVVKPM